METDKYLKRLEKSGIKPTAIRLLVLDAISQKTEIFSLLDLEAVLETLGFAAISPLALNPHLGK